MFKQFVITSLTIIISEISAMVPPVPDARIYVVNEVSSTVPFTDPPSIFARYLRGNKEREIIVRPGAQAEELIGNFRSFDLGSSLTIGGYGELRGQLTSPLTLPIQSLVDQWTVLQKAPHNDLVITVKWTSRISFSIETTLTTRPQKSKPFENIPQNPLDAFPALVTNRLTNIPLAKIENGKWDMIFKEPSSSLLGWAGAQKATTGEDMYRYILGLGKEYSKDDIDEQFKKLALLWHPDKGIIAMEVATAKDKEVATTIFRLSQKAKEELLEALAQKT